MSNQEKFTPQFEQGKDLHTMAEQARNPYQDQLRAISDEYSEKLRGHGGSIRKDIGTKWAKSSERPKFYKKHKKLFGAMN